MSSKGVREGGGDDEVDSEVKKMMFSMMMIINSVMIMVIMCRKTIDSFQGFCRQILKTKH